MNGSLALFSSEEDVLACLPLRLLEAGKDQTGLALEWLPGASAVTVSSVSEPFTGAE